LLGQPQVLLRPPGRLLPVPLVVGGSGDLQDRARPVDAALPSLLRLDERVHVHRLPLAKKAVARFRMSRSSRSTRFSLRSRTSSSCSLLVSPGLRPASISACSTHRRTELSVRPRSRATSGIVRSPFRQSSTTSALKLSVNALRRRRCRIVSSIGEQPPRGYSPISWLSGLSGETQEQLRSTAT